MDMLRQRTSADGQPPLKCASVKAVSDSAEGGSTCSVPTNGGSRGGKNAPFA